MMPTYTYRLVLSLCFLLVIAACRSNRAEDPALKEAQTIFEESMAMHDEVMPKMGQAEARIEDLQQAINRMNVRAMPIDEAQMGALQATQQQLKEAHEGMMQWMKDTSPIPSRALQPAELAQLLQVQKKQHARIREIREQMNTGLSKAVELLGQ